VGYTDSLDLSDRNVILIKVSSDNINLPPEKPTLTGPSQGRIGTSYTFSAWTSDVENESVYFLFDWADGNNSGWLGPYNSGVTCEAKHTWIVKNSYNIKVKAKDIYGAESPWSDPLPITMPYSFNKPLLQFLELLFQRFPNAFSLLQQLLRY
jgi:hypothetical protein